MRDKSFVTMEQQLRDKLVEIMMTALKERGGIHLTDDEYSRLFNKLESALIGSIRL